MVSNQYKCIFIEVPKTGSTSIRTIIGQPEKPHLDIRQTKIEIESVLQLNAIYNGNNQQDWDPKKVQQQADQLFNDYFKFAFVCNPWDRTVSLYERREGQQMAQQMTFEEFVHWIEYSSDTCLQPTRHKNQLDWLTDSDGKVAMDFIGRFERLDEDWQGICDRLNIGNKPLPHVNKNPGQQKHYSESYTDKTRKIIADKFKVDIEYFGYEFGD
jgi:hypothetical protein